MKPREHDECYFGNEPLGEAFKNIPTGSERQTATVKPVGVKVSLDGLEDNQKTVAVANWQALIDAVGQRGAVDPRDCPECTDGDTGGEMLHTINHSTFEFRFAPPWFNADQRSLFTSYVVFPEEARLEEWVEDPAQSCDGEDASAAVCPDRAFHREVTGPFLKALAQCATPEKKVTLRTVGFASSSGIDDSERTSSLLKELHGDHVATINNVTTITDVCFSQSETSPVFADANDSSNQFNLLVANRRARNAAEMLRSFTSAEEFDIKATPWCSHADVVAQRYHDDESNGNYDVAKGLMNRRAEVRLVDIAGCLNVDPDNRLDGGKQTRSGQQ